MGRVPQLILSLSPEDALVLELPGPGGLRRKVELRPGQEAEIMLRILRAQREDRTEIGFDGSPTQAQVEHWERHQQWPKQSCRFCLAEGRFKHGPLPPRAKPILVAKSGTGRNSVEVRRIKAGAGASGKVRGPKPSGKSAKEMGL